jgi:hypothetical protein
MNKTTLIKIIAESLFKMSAIDPNKCLPPELTVQSVDDILYKIGFVFRQNLIDL